MKILLSIPTFESIEPDTFKSVYGLDKCGHTVLFSFTRGYDCARARNEIAKGAVAGNYDYVLMVDSDIILPSDALEHLTNPLVDICLGAYPKRNAASGESVLFRPGEFDYTNQFCIPMSEIFSASSARAELHGGGLGCALIKTDVFRALPFPWFKYVTYDNDTILSEDLYFCDLAGKNGFKIYADNRVRCGHITKAAHYW